MIADDLQTRDRRAFLLCAVAALALLAACGKKGPPKPLEGEEARYTYPRTYPAPRSVVPQKNVPKERVTQTRPGDERNREFPFERTRTRVIESE